MPALTRRETAQAWGEIMPEPAALVQSGLNAGEKCPLNSARQCEVNNLDGMCVIAVAQGQ
jgi:hypothetical protein